MKLTIEDIFPWIFLVLFILVFAVLITTMIGEEVSRNKGCEAIGFKEYEYVGHYPYCRDYSGNLYHVYVEDSKLFKTAKIKTITVGDYRTVND